LKIIVAAVIIKCFRNVDSGKIEPAEVKESLLKLGVNIDLAEAKRLTQRFVLCAQCTVLVSHRVERR